MTTKLHKRQHQVLGTLGRVPYLKTIYTVQGGTCRAWFLGGGCAQKLLDEVHFREWKELTDELTTSNSSSVGQSRC